MAQVERKTELLVDALAFAFVSCCVNELGVRPTLDAIARFRQAATEALARAARDPWGDDEPTSPETATRRRH